MDSLRLKFAFTSPHKNHVIFLFVIVLLVFTSIGFSGCAQTKPTMQSTTSSEETTTVQSSGSFNFVFGYGVGAKNQLDTFKGTYTRDMVQDPSITIPLTLTESEKKQILDKMNEINFFSYPDVFTITNSPGVMTTIITPYDSYYFRVEYGTITKELSWNAQNSSPSEQADKLNELIKLIRYIIQSKDEFKNLPHPTGGYM